MYLTSFDAYFSFSAKPHFSRDFSIVNLTKSCFNLSFSPVVFLAIWDNLTGPISSADNSAIAKRIFWVSNSLEDSSKYLKQFSLRLFTFKIRAIRSSSLSNYNHHFSLQLILKVIDILFLIKS